MGDTSARTPQNYDKYDNMYDFGEDFEEDEDAFYRQDAQNKPITTTEVLKSDYPHYKFHGEVYRLLKNPDRAFVVMMFGKRGNGKSSLSIQLADYFAKNFGEVLYVSNEEFKEYEKASKSLQDNIILNGVDSDNIRWTKDLEGLDLNEFDFVFVDSVQSVGLSVKDFEQLKKQYPNTAFILIFQVSKGGDFSGSGVWAHLVDGIFEVKQFTTYNQKRFAGEATENEPVEIKGLYKKLKKQ